MKNDTYKIWLIFFVVVLINIMLAGFIAHQNTVAKEKYQNGLEVRCWYCSKVIVNSKGRVIHATRDHDNYFKCDYCGKNNKIK